VTSPSPEALLAVAVEAARAGGDVSLQWQGRRDTLRVEQKAGPNDLVSAADRDSERSIRAVLEKQRPHDAVVGEEFGSTSGSSGIWWAIDPIDGTTNYLYGRADWAVSVAAMSVEGDILAAVVLEPVIALLTSAARDKGTTINGEPVSVSHVPDLKTALVEMNLGRSEQRASTAKAISILLPHINDMRRSGSAAAALAQVASGRADAFWGPGLNVWDCAAGVLLTRESGCLVGDLHGSLSSGIPASGDILAAGKPIWDDLVSLLSPLYEASDEPTLADHGPQVDQVPRP
jgi:myo-inositol-1(or 4)-monophosphatase